MFGALLYAKLFSIPILVSYHTHIPQYIPQYTWAGLVEPMWKLIRFCVRAADVTLVVSSQSKVHPGLLWTQPCSPCLGVISTGGQR